MEATEKACTKCGEKKSIEKFGNSAIAADGKKSWCKACDAAYARERWAAKKRTVRQPKDKIASGAKVLRTIMEKTGAMPKAPAAPPAGNGTAEQLAGEHWGYIEALLKAHLEEVSDLACIEFHYKSAFVHGYKHGVERGER